MGKNVFIDDEVLIEASKEVMLGDNVVIGPRVVVFNTGYDLVAQKHLDNVIISTGVYIGPGAIICPGVKIEENSVVCPGAARALANCGHKKMFERERARDISICSQFLKKELNCLYVKVE